MRPSSSLSREVTTILSILTAYSIVVLLTGECCMLSSLKTNVFLLLEASSKLHALNNHRKAFFVKCKKRNVCYILLGKIENGDSSFRTKCISFKGNSFVQKSEEKAAVLKWITEH